MFVPLVHGSADLDRQTLEIDGQTLTLSPNEARLFRYLAERPGQTVDHDELLREVFGYAKQVRSRTVITTMQRLRKKVEADPAEPVHLRSVYGRGYVFEPLGEGEGLIGRTDELAELRARLEGGRLWLVAPGGYGKSTLARHFARIVGSGAVWIDLTGSLTVEGLLSATTAALGIAPVDTAESVRFAIHHRAPPLVVLDAAEDLGDQLLPFVRDWSTFVPVVVTSRVPHAGEPTLELGPLAPDDAVRLFVRCVPRAVEPEAVEALLQRLGGVPLALELAAARLGQFSAADLQTQLDDLGGLLAGGHGRQASMDDVLGWSWAHLPPPLREAVGRLVPVRRGIRVADAVALVGGAGLDAIAELRRWGWLTQRDGRVYMLDPVRQFVESRCDRARAEAAHRHLFLSEARRREEDLLGGRGREFLDAEWGNLRAALRTGWRARATESVELALLLVPTMGQRVPMAEALRWLDEASRIATGHLLGDVLVLRAALWMSRSSLDAAEADLRRAEEVGVRDPGLLALRWGRLHQDRLALDASRAALERARGALSGPWQLQAELALAYTLLKAGAEDAALAMLRQVLARARISQSPSHTLLALGTLGILHTQRDEFEAAREAHVEALRICEEVGLDLVAARVHTQLGAVELYRGEPAAADRHWSAAMEISKRLGARVGVAMGQVNLANLRLAGGQHAAAGALFDEACRTFEEAGFAPGLAYATLGIGRLASRQGRYAAAEARFDTCEGGLPPQLRWLVGVERCIARAEQGDGAGARAALDAGAAPTDAGSEAGRALAGAFCDALDAPERRSASIPAALAGAAAIRDPVIAELADRLRRFATG